MTLHHRLTLAAGLLLVGVAGQYALVLHLQSQQAHYPPLAQKLDRFPRQFHSPHPENSKESLLWVGSDVALPENFLQRQDLSLDDVLFRNYQCRSAHVSAEIYLGYSKIAEDRKHHPIVCINAVLGIPEDEAARKTIYLDETNKKPAQRFSFRTPSRATTVYYWHYTFALPRDQLLSPLQEAHQKFSRPPPSLTVQVFTTAAGSQLDLFEKGWLIQVEEVIGRDYVPANSVVDCYWLNIGVVKK